MEKARVRAARRARAGRHARSRPGLGYGAGLLFGTAILSVVVLIAGVIFLIAPRGGQTPASAAVSQPGAITWDGRSAINVLLLGVHGEAAQRSSADALLVASFHSDGGRISLLAIPPKLWVTVPGFGSAPIAQSLAEGGPSLALLTAESALKAPIQYYVELTPVALGRLVDAAGGIQLNLIAPLTVREGFQTEQFPPGTQQLDGTAAAAYWQGLDGNALSQRLAIVAAIGRKLSLPDALVHLPDIVTAVGASVPTNFPYSQIPQLVHMFSSIAAGQVHLASLGPANGTASSYQAGGAAVLLPDWNRVAALSRRLLGDPSLSRDGSVDVLNGSGVSGQAAALAVWLQGVGVSVHSYRSAESFGYARTQVRLSSSATAPEQRLAHAVASLLQARLEIRQTNRATSHIAVIIGSDFQDLSQQ